MPVIKITDKKRKRKTGASPDLAHQALAKDRDGAGSQMATKSGGFEARRQRQCHRNLLLYILFREEKERATLVTKKAQDQTKLFF